MNRILTLGLALPLALAAGCSGNNAKSCTTTTSGDVQTLTCPDGTSATVNKGGAGTTGTPGKTTLVSVVAEPAGTNCGNGGSAIETGIDTNGDGTLAATEVTSTSYVCSTTSPTSDTIVGSVIVRNSFDLAQLAGVKTITGDLFVTQIDGLTSISLPSLEHIRGGLVMYSVSLTSVSMPALVDVGRRMQMRDDSNDGTITSLGFGSLTKVGSLSLQQLYALPDLSGLSHLANVEEDIDLGNLSVTTLDPITAAFGTAAGSIYIQSNDNLTDVSALSSLVGIGSLYISSCPITDLPLTSLTSVIDFQVKNTDVATISAPLLTKIDGQAVVESNDSLTSISFGSLLTVGSSMYVDGLPLLTSLWLPKLKTVTGQLFISSNPVLPSFSAGALTTADGVEIDGNDALTSISLGAMTSVSNELYVNSNNLLTSLDVSLLATVGGNFAVNHTNATSLAFPKLLSVGNELSVSSNPLLTSLTFASVSSATHLVVGNFTVITNPKLSQCPLDVIVANTTITSGNAANLAGNDASCKT